MRRHASRAGRFEAKLHWALQSATSDRLIGDDLVRALVVRCVWHDHPTNQSVPFREVSRVLMRIEIEVELSEKVEDGTIETRRFSRDVEMELPAVGAEIELNVAAEPVTATVTNIIRAAGDTQSRVNVRSESLTFKSLREDERWNEKLIQSVGSHST